MFVLKEDNGCSDSDFIFYNHGTGMDAIEHWAAAPAKAGAT